MNPGLLPLSPVTEPHIWGGCVWQGDGRSDRARGGHRVNGERSTPTGRQTGQVRTEGARSQRDLQGGAASTEEREGESGRSARGVGAQTPGLVTDEGGRGRRGQEKSQQTPRGGGRRTERGSAGFVSCGALDAECFRPICNEWMVGYSLLTTLQSLSSQQKEKEEKSHLNGVIRVAH